MDAVQVCDVNTADNTNAIIFQMRLTQGDILPDNMTGFYWILIGRVQQWGYFYESQSDTDYRHFPVAFTTFLLPVLGKAYYLTTEPDGYVPYIEYLGSNNFLCGFGNNRIGNAYVPIMVIGMQQWGSPYVAGKNEFLLAFSEFVVMAASSEYSYTADNMVQFAYLNYFHCNAGTLNSHRGWIALGI